MRMTRLLNDKLNTDNSGFSIVELIIAIGILAAVSIPVLKSFSMASVTNSKAQKLQNVTSVAEKSMEEIKGYSIEQLYEEATTSSRKDSILFLSGADAEGYLAGGSFSADSADYKEPPYVVIYQNVTATQGTTYEVRAVIDDEPYNQSGNEDASDINSVALPELYDIQDSKDHIILSWEMSKYDKVALSKLSEENTKTDSENTTVKDYIRDYGIKTTTITLTTPPGSSNLVDIKCKVKYQPDESMTLYKKTLEYDVYSGQLKNLAINKKSDGGPHVYLFYKMAVLDGDDYMPHEIIDVVDNTTSGTHNVYLMLQNDGFLNDLKYSTATKAADVELKYKGTSLAKHNGNPNYRISKTQWNKDDLAAFGDNTFYTNLTSNDDTIEDGKLYKVKRKNRVYKVTVSVYENGVFVTDLNSSMNAGNEADN